jgi:hypothetical protein
MYVYIKLDRKYFDFQIGVIRIIETRISLKLCDFEDNF